MNKPATRPQWTCNKNFCFHIIRGAEAIGSRITLFKILPTSTNPYRADVIFERSHIPNHNSFSPEPNIWDRNLKVMALNGSIVNWPKYWESYKLLMINLTNQLYSLVYLLSVVSNTLHSPPIALQNWPLVLVEERPNKLPICYSVSVAWSSLDSLNRS